MLSNIVKKNLKLYKCSQLTESSSTQSRGLRHSKTRSVNTCTQEESNQDLNHPLCRQRPEQMCSFGLTIFVASKWDAHYMDMIAGRLDEVKRENTLVIRPNTTVVLTTEITTIHMIYLCVGFSVFGFSQAVLFLKRFSRFSTLPISSLVHTFSRNAHVNLRSS